MKKASMYGKPLLDVLSGRKPERRPIWFMRQAGRYLPEYRRLREQAGSFLTLCYTPELAAEASLQPLRRYDLDAAIVFADILVVPNAMGLRLQFEEGEGPVLERIQSQEDLRRLNPLGEEVRSVYETLRLVRTQLRENVALIGFCGGPWTVDSYMIEGGTSDRELSKAMAARRVSWFLDVIDMLVEESIEYLCGQVEAGAEAVQIFDSWAGDLPEVQRNEFVQKPLAALVEGFHKRHPDVPVIVFARGVGHDHLAIQKATAAQGIGIETELSMDWARENLKGAIQGNLDPEVLLGPDEAARQAAVKLAAAMPIGRHIFNLGHGIRPATRPEVLQAVIDAVRQHDKSMAS